MKNTKLILVVACHDQSVHLESIDVIDSIKQYDEIVLRTNGDCTADYTLWEVPCDRVEWLLGLEYLAYNDEEFEAVGMVDITEAEKWDEPRVREYVENHLTTP